MSNVTLYGHDKETGAEIMRIEEPWGVEYRKTNNKLHRDDGPAEEHNDGSKSWYKNGKLHREDGPAFEHKDGSKFWYKQDMLHRVDGPAMVGADGEEQWYWWGNKFSKEEYTKYAQQDYEYKKSLNQLPITNEKSDINKSICDIREKNKNVISYSFKIK